jgi:hypothetical protein
MIASDLGIQFGLTQNGDTGIEFCSATMETRGGLR